MVLKLNRAKSLLLEKLKKSNNGQIVQINDFVHKRCNLKANYIIETTVKMKLEMKTF
jgi:hypothetical protein